VKQQWGGNISKWKAWACIVRAHELKFGTWQSSVMELPRYLEELKFSNPGTVIEWEHNKDARGQNLFKYVFWAFGFAIQGFKFCRPVLCIDATHLYGSYNYKLLVCVGIDASNCIFPVAYAFVHGESEEDWEFFIRQLDRHVICGRNDVCMISDRSSGL
ncbi:hypothetical protein M569_10669, partial [Genlisea aurea]